MDRPEPTSGGVRFKLAVADPGLSLSGRWPGPVAHARLANGGHNVVRQRRRGRWLPVGAAGVCVFWRQWAIGVDTVQHSGALAAFGAKTGRAILAQWASGAGWRACSWRTLALAPVLHPCGRFANATGAAQDRNQPVRRTAMVGRVCATGHGACCLSGSAWCGTFASMEG